MGVMKIIYPISDETIKEIKANKLSFEDFANANQANSFSFDKFSADFYLMFSYTGNFTIGSIMESGSYAEDKQNYFLECRYIAASKIKKIYAWAKRVTPEKFKNFAVRYERIDNYGTKITEENYQEYFDRCIKNFAEFVIKTVEKGCGFLLVSM
jgi:hypothetical protein